MVNIGLTATQAMNPRARRAKNPHATGKGTHGRRESIVTGLHAKSMGLKSHGRSGRTLTNLHAKGMS